MELRLDRPWLGQSLKVCASVACWTVCPARRKDVSSATGLFGDNVDGELGVAKQAQYPDRDVLNGGAPTPAARAAAGLTSLGLAYGAEGSANSVPVIAL